MLAGGALGQVCGGVVGFSNLLQEASSGAGGFVWTARMCRRGHDRFDFETLPCRARKSSPCGSVVIVNARNSSPSGLKYPKFRRFWACWASFFAGEPVEEPCWASFFALTDAPGLVGGVRPPCLQWWGFCTTRSRRTACRRRVGPSCSAIPPRRHNKTARHAAGRGWSGRRESNPPLKLGKLPFYR